SGSSLSIGCCLRLVLRYPAFSQFCSCSNGKFGRGVLIRCGEGSPSNAPPQRGPRPVGQTPATRPFIVFLALPMLVSALPRRPWPSSAGRGPSSSRAGARVGGPAVVLGPPGSASAQELLSKGPVLRPLRLGSHHRH